MVGIHHIDCIILNLITLPENNMRTVCLALFGAAVSAIQLNAALEQTENAPGFGMEHDNATDDM